MDPARDILSELQAAGVTVTRAGDRLRLAPPHVVTPRLLERVKENKPSLLRLLAGPEARREVYVKPSASAAKMRWESDRGFLVEAASPEALRRMIQFTQELMREVGLVPLPPVEV